MQTSLNSSQAHAHAQGVAPPSVGQRLDLGVAHGIPTLCASFRRWWRATTYTRTRFRDHQGDPRMTHSDELHPPRPAARGNLSPAASTTPAAVTLAEIQANLTWGRSRDDLVDTLEGLRRVGLLEHVPDEPITEVINPAVTGSPEEY